METEILFVSELQAGGASRRAEHARLEAAVVKLAKIEYLATEDMRVAFDADNMEQLDDAKEHRDIARTARLKAVRALIAFEAEQGIVNV